VYLVRNILIPVQKDIQLKEAVSKKLQIRKDRIGQVQILRRALDARKKNHLKFNFTVLVKDLPDIEHQDITIYKDPIPYINEEEKLSDKNPFIIGAGPAGLFSALGLVEKGFQPIIFDRGAKLENRVLKVKKFWEDGELDEECNVQFGEGGAGTFSDGKLTSRNRDFYSNKIFDYLVKFGADENIKYEALPHLGTDKLRKIILNIRNFLTENGCKFYWNHKLENILLNNGKLQKVVINETTYSPEILILAVGNAARDTFMILDSLNAITSKPFAVGFRIEHKQDFINNSFYGDRTDISLTGPATYRLTAKKGSKGIFSFCMCPGGFVIGAASEKEHLVINGMSFHDRSNEYANSAIVASVDEKDFGKGPLAGINFQKKIEYSCFSSSGSYNAPVQSASDFMNSKTSINTPHNSFMPGVNTIDMNGLLPFPLVQNLKFGLQVFDKRIPGFNENGVLIAPETRTSSPVRIVRDKQKRHSISAENLYPVGEGSGYAGGIISSAVDGYKTSQIFVL